MIIFLGESKYEKYSDLNNIRQHSKHTKKKHSRNSLRKPHKKHTLHPNKRIRITKCQNRINTTHNSNKPQKNIPQNNPKIT